MDTSDLVNQDAFSAPQGSTASIAKDKKKVDADTGKKVQASYKMLQEKGLIPDGKITPEQKAQMLAAVKQSKIMSSKDFERLVFREYRPRYS